MKYADPPLTSWQTDQEFTDLCKAGRCTFNRAMKYLRLNNNSEFRGKKIKYCVPSSLREQVTTQCILEELI